MMMMSISHRLIRLVNPKSKSKSILSLSLS